MYYIQLKSGKTTVEFHNNWLGVETVSANGQVVSKKSSIMGTHHHFSLLEEGHHVRYVLTTKIDLNMQVLIDLRRNGAFVHENVVVPLGGKVRGPRNTTKHQGLRHLKEYELEEALAAFNQALDIDPTDAEIHFHMACAYSVLERRGEAFAALRKAVEHGLSDTDSIIEHDMLAYLRLSPAFPGFVASGFTEYNPNNLEETCEDGDFV